MTCSQARRHDWAIVGYLPTPRTRLERVQRLLGGLGAHRGGVADLDPQGIEEDHRVHRLERPVLPGGELGGKR
jgi:hypothetical protein